MEGWVFDWNRRRKKKKKKKKEEEETLSLNSFISCCAADFISRASFCSTNFLNTEISSELSAQSSK
jgi:hypothetical protein